MLKQIYWMVTLTLAAATLCLAQFSGQTVTGVVRNAGPSEPVTAVGPFREGIRPVTLPKDLVEELDGDTEDPPRRVSLPATPATAGASLLAALVQWEIPLHSLLTMAWEESFLTGPGHAQANENQAQAKIANAPLLDRSVALATFWPNGAPAATKNDPQVASGNWAVGVLSWDTVAFYDKSGTLLPSTPTFVNPTSTETLFAPIVAILDANIKLDPSVQMQGNTDFLFAKGQIGDARMEFDVFRKRWVILATAKNSGQPAGKYSDSVRRSQRRTNFLLAISIDEDPSHGFYTYQFPASPDNGACGSLSDSQPCPNSNFTPGDGSDYPSLGMSSHHYLLTIGSAHVPLDGSAATKKWAYLVTVNANDAASGLAHPHAHAFWKWDLGFNKTADYISQPVVSTQAISPNDMGLIVSMTDSRLVLTSVSTTDPPVLTSGSWSMPNLTPLPGDWGQKGSTRGVQYSNVLNESIKATQHGGILAVTWNDCRNWLSVSAPCSPSVHLFTAQVNAFPLVAFSLQDRVFGHRNAVDDVAADVVAYGMPGIAVNKDKDLALVYARTSPVIFPEVRYSTWIHGEPDIRPSRLLRVGDGPFPCAIPCTAPAVTYDTSGISLDPFDNTAVWMAHVYPNSQGLQALTVGKVFGAPHPGLKVSAVSSNKSPVAPGDTIVITYTVSNYGDGVADPVDILIDLVSVTGGPDVLLSNYSLLAIQPGGQSAGVQKVVVLKANVPRGIYSIRVAANSGKAAQYTQGVNFADSAQTLVIQ